MTECTSPDEYDDRLCANITITFEVDGIGVAQCFRPHVDLLVGHGGEEGNHVVMAVVSNRGHLIREAGVLPGTPHPLLKDGVGEGVQHLWAGASHGN